MNIWCLILTLTLCLRCGVSEKFPDDPKPCKYSDINCLSKTIEYFLSQKSQGDSSINLVKFDPLEVKQISFKQNFGSPVSIDLTLSNSKIYGLSTVKAVNVKGFGKDMTGTHELTFSADHLEFVGDYAVKGKVLVLPIVGHGKSNVTLLNADFVMKFTGIPVEKDGDFYMKIDHFKLQLEPKKMIYFIDNLFNGDKALSDNMILFLNENWSEIYTEVQGSINSAFGKIFHSIIGNVFTKYPYHKFFAE